MINNIDYSEYSLDELLDVKRHIDPEEAPENYQNLMTELKKRDNEIRSREVLISEKRKKKSEKRKKKYRKTYKNKPQLRPEISSIQI